MKKRNNEEKQIRDFIFLFNYMSENYYVSNYKPFRCLVLILIRRTIERQNRKDYYYKGINNFKYFHVRFIKFTKCYKCQ